MGRNFRGAVSVEDKDNFRGLTEVLTTVRGYSNPELRESEREPDDRESEKIDMLIIPSY